MFDRIDACPDRHLGACGAVAWAAVRLFEPVRLVHDGVHFRLRHCGVSTASASDSTPPVAHTLITSAPYFTWKRTASRN